MEDAARLLCGWQNVVRSNVSYNDQI